MADQELDTLEGTGETDTSQQTQEDQEQAALVFGKYKSIDEAQKGFKELERKLHEVATENSTLKKDTELKSVLEKMAQAVEGQNKPDDGKNSFDSMVEELGEVFRENPAEGVRRFTKVMDAYVADEGKKVKGETEKQLNELKSTIEQIREGMVNLNPEYQENREMVDQLVSDGMPKAKAIEWAKKLRGQSRVLPVSVNGQRRPSANANVYLTKEDRERMKREDGFTDEDCDELERQHQERREQMGKLYQQTR